jgi:hypothetical protein
MCSYELDEISSLKKNSLVPKLVLQIYIYLSIYLSTLLALFVRMLLTLLFRSILKLLGVNHNLKLQRMVKAFELHNEMRVK